MVTTKLDRICTAETVTMASQPRRNLGRTTTMAITVATILKRISITPDMVMT
ncbi:hypothetical protein DY000_02032495 [Brassica cretica]|uniref:Uncharacterized protein n=1 Tax=Brassica cretica TaxID=69181 RepID=A0ABQ7E026_BRACR|nr:hypothetical protein DY000_02032495 [Brassica cretica]